MDMQIKFSKEKISISKDLEICIFEIKGKIDLSTVERLKTVLSDALEKGYRHFVIKMRGVKAIKSTGIGAILDFAKQVDRVGGNLRMADIPPNITNVFDVLSVGDVLVIHGTLAEAIVSFKGLFDRNVRKIEALKERNEALEKKLKGTDQEIPSTSDPIAFIHQFLKQLQTDNQALKRKIGKKEIEIKNLRNELDRYKKG